MAAAWIPPLVLLAGAVFANETGSPGDILWTEVKLYSYGNEELIIRDYFQDRRDGFFVDVGCSHPRKNSNTYYLEKHLGWRGIGVDGVPGYAKGWKTLRPASTFLNFVVTDHSDTLEPFHQSVVWGLSTAEKEVAKHRRTREIHVPSITLDDLLERQGVAKIDLLSIDVEGHHEKVLSGFDLARWRPELVCIEEEGMFAVPWFRERGYAPIERYRDRDIVNWYFAPVELAATADARRSETGEEEMRRRRERLAAEPPGSPLRTLRTPRVVLDAAGRPVWNRPPDD